MARWRGIAACHPSPLQARHDSTTARMMAVRSLEDVLQYEGTKMLVSTFQPVTGFIVSRES